MADEITDEDLATAALDPKRAKSDQDEFEAHSIPDVIAAGKELERRNAGNHSESPWRRLRAARATFPGMSD